MGGNGGAAGRIAATHAPEVRSPQQLVQIDVEVLENNAEVLAVHEVVLCAKAHGKKAPGTGKGRQAGGWERAMQMGVLLPIISEWPMQYPPSAMANARTTREQHNRSNNLRSVHQH